MSAPSQMTRHTLEAPKGWPNPHAVDFAAKLDPAVTIDVVHAGRVVHINRSGNYEMGLPTGARLGHMPIFLFQNSNDPDVANPGGNPATEAGVWVAVAPTGVIMGLVAAGAYELQSTEFVPEASDGTYYPGDTLTAEADNTTFATGGVIKHGTAYLAPLCGVVSRGVFTNCYGRPCLSFWPVWLPQAPASN
jgi:hypothetical protein